MWPRRTLYDTAKRKLVPVRVEVQGLMRWSQSRLDGEVMALQLILQEMVHSSMEVVPWLRAMSVLSKELLALEEVEYLPLSECRL